MRSLQRRVQHLLGIAGLAAATLLLAGCPGTEQLPHVQPPGPPGPGIDAILLQKGDSIEVDLTGTPMPILPSTFMLSGTGNISLPLLETNIPAIGKTPHELEKIIHDLYVPSFYAHISVTVIPGNRYYYVSGEVNQTQNGKQLYTGKVTVLGAIGAAGGFNDYAAKTKVQLTRQDGTILIEDCKKALTDPKLDLEVLPGDKIFVPKQTLGDIPFGR